MLGLHPPQGVHRHGVAGRQHVQRPLVPRVRPRLLRRGGPLQPLPRGQQRKYLVVVYTFCSKQSAKYTKQKIETFNEPYSSYPDVSGIKANHVQHMSLDKKRKAKKEKKRREEGGAHIK